MQGTAEFHHEIADPLLPQADAVFDDAAALDTTVDMFDPQPPLVERLVGQNRKGIRSKSAPRMTIRAIPVQR